jgi:hypothetical protein
MYAMTFVISDNDACAQKPDSGHDTLDNAARVGAAAALDRKNGQCRPEANEAKRAHARWLAVKIAIKAHYGANQGRSAEPQGDVEGVHSGVIYRKQRLDTRSEQKPRKHADRSRTMISGAAMAPFLQNDTATR